MQKVIPLGTATSREAAAAATSRVLRFPDTLDRTNRTFVCTVVFVDLVEYSKKPVAEQLQVKERLNSHISEAIQDIAASDRIILDTGDGVAINFLGDPEDALFVAVNLAQSFTGTPAGEPVLEARIGINLGPVRLVRDINSQPNIIGDGINVAQRVMSFAQRGQVLVSRSYYDVVTRISEDYARLFAYQGSRTDKHVREHEIYEVATPNSEAHELTLRRKHARPGTSASDRTDGAHAQVGQRLLANRRLAFAVTGFSIFALAAAALYFVTASRAPELETHLAGDQAARHAATQPMLNSPLSSQTDAPAAPTGGASDATVSVRIQETSIQEPAGMAAIKPGAGATGRRAPRESAAPNSLESPRPQDPPSPPAEAKAEASEPVRPVLAPIVPTPAPPAPIHEHKPPAGPTAVVLLAISPWGEVFVDGKLAGVSPPLAELELAVGMHRVEVRNGSFKPYVEDVDLASNQTTKIKHKFAQGR
jgi:class 3 adenylate cyclase